MSAAGWPPLDDAAREWVCLTDEQWRERLTALIGARPPAVFDGPALASAYGYPWERPGSSFILRDGAVELVAGIARAERRAILAEAARGRHPLLAFGANGAPERLTTRFADFPDRADREALVLAGELHDLDVGAQASPSIFGYLPAVLFASPGTAVRASVLWLTPRQLARITLAELGYRIGRLDRARFTAEEEGVAVSGLFAYVSRVGALSLNGGPTALAAVPARGRRAPEQTQEELLGTVARLVFGPGVGAAELVRMCLEDASTAIARIWSVTRPAAIDLPPDHWTPYPSPHSVGTDGRGG